MLTVLLGLSFALARAADAPRPDWSSDDAARLDVQVQVIRTLVDSGMAERALAVITDVREQGADDGRLDVLQARALHATGMSAEAQAQLEGHLRTTPRDADAWAALGVVRADRSDLPGAADALERARKLNPKDATVLNNLAYVRLSTGDAEAAVRLLQASLALDPSQARTRNNLGFALARLERDTEALQAFRAAGSEADARYNLGVACVRRGDRASALTQFHAALEAAPGHPGATAALERLSQEAP